MPAQAVIENLVARSVPGLRVRGDLRAWRSVGLSNTNGHRDLRRSNCAG